MDLRGIRVRGQQAKDTYPFSVLEFANATIDPDPDEHNVGVITFTATDNIVSFEEFGAIGDDDHDDTDSILAAWNYASLHNFPIVPTGGKTYVYNGPGLDNWESPVIAAAGNNQATFHLGASSYLVSQTNPTASMFLQGFNTIGGFGVWRSLYTGAHVQGFHRFQDIYAQAYTKVAFSNIADDFPYIVFDYCRFYGANYTTTMGMALRGFSDGGSITNCDFLANRVHVKLGRAFNFYIDKCDFLRLGAPTGFPRIDVWEVPGDISNVQGSGLTITPSNKFGNELLDPDDYRIVFADEGAGADFTSKFPDLTTESTGYIAGNRIGGDFFGEGANVHGSVPCVFSTAPLMLNTTIGDITVAATPPSHIFKMLNAAPTAVVGYNTDNTIGPVNAIGTLGYFFAPLATNCPGMFARIIDPQGVLTNLDPQIPNRFSVPDPVDLVDMNLASVRTWDLASGVTRNNVADSYGGINAAEFVTPGAQIVCSAGFVNTPIEGVNHYVELDIAPGSSSSLTNLQVRIIDSGGAIYQTWSVTVPPSYKRWYECFRWKGPAPLAGIWGVQLVANTAGRVTIGRVHVYASRDPQNIDGKLGKPGQMIHMGLGVPASGLGTNGDFYFRSDGTAAAKTTIYHRESGSWVVVDQ